MNTVNEPSIAAVVFVNMTLNSNHKLGKPAEKPYFYLNVIGAQVGNYALVHNSEAFGLVKVARIVDTKEAQALQKVHKPLLALINYDEELLATASTKLKEYVERTVDDRVQANIDAELVNPIHKGLAPAWPAYSIEVMATIPKRDDYETYEQWMRAVSTWQLQVRDVGSRLSVGAPLAKRDKKYGQPRTPAETVDDDI